MVLFEKDAGNSLYESMLMDIAPSLPSFTETNRRGHPGREFVLGAGGGMLLHFLILTALVLTASWFPRHAVRLAYISVQLVSSGGSGGGEPAERLENPVRQSEGELEDRLRATPPEPGPREDNPAESTEPEPVDTKRVVPEKSPVEIVKPRQAVMPKPKADHRKVKERAGKHDSPSTIPSSPPLPAAPPGSSSGSGGATGGELRPGPGGPPGPASSGFSSGTEFELHQVDVPPRLLQKTEPEYPREARQKRMDGKVVVKFLVEPDGHTSKHAIVSADPKGIFDRNVLEAIRKWRFKPGVHQGKPVSTWVILPVKFNLSS